MTLGRTAGARLSRYLRACSPSSAEETERAGEASRRESNSRMTTSSSMTRMRSFGGGAACMGGFIINLIGCGDWVARRLAGKRVIRDARRASTIK